MSTVADKTEYTPEDLLAMPDGDHYELVNGVLVERHMGILAGWVSGELFRLVSTYYRERRLGWVFPPGDAGYQGFPDSPRTVRKPDVSFVAHGRFPGEKLPSGYARLSPDLVAEGVSPHHLYGEVDQKVEEYLRAGVRLVWVVNPENLTVRVYRLDGTSQSLRANDAIDGEGVLPGFRCAVRNLSPPEGAEPTGPAAGNGEGGA